MRHLVGGCCRVSLPAVEHIKNSLAVWGLIFPVLVVVTGGFMLCCLFEAFLSLCVEPTKVLHFVGAFPVGFSLSAVSANSTTPLL